MEHRSGRCLSGGGIFAEYALDTAREAVGRGLKNVFVSNGYMTPELLELMVGLIHAINVDLKAGRGEFYHKISGADLKPVLANLKTIQRLGIWLEVTTLVIPGLNDSDEELRWVASYLLNELGPDVPWHVSRFYPQYQMSESRRRRPPRWHAPGRSAGRSGCATSTWATCPATNRRAPSVRAAARWSSSAPATTCGFVRCETARAPGAARPSRAWRCGFDERKDLGTLVARHGRVRGALRGLPWLLGIGVLVAALVAAWPVVAGSGMDVTVSVDGYEETVRTSRSSVAQLLTDLGVRVRPEDRVTPALDTPVTPGMAVTIRRARLGAVEADGTTFTAYTHAGDVGGLLADVGLDVAPHDEIWMSA